MLLPARIELFLIGMCVLLAWFAAPLLSRQLSLSVVLGMTCALLLLQGLVRDIAILVRVRRKSGASLPQSGRYLCVESTVGLLGIAAGALLIGTHLDVPLLLDQGEVALLVCATMIAGFSGRDWVIQAKPWRIFHDPDHINVIVAWKR